MVVGAGRGPLVRSAFNASINVRRKIKMYVVEKNPNAIVTLTALQEEMWHDKGIHLFCIQCKTEHVFSIIAFSLDLHVLICRYDNNIDRHEILHAG